MKTDDGTMHLNLHVAIICMVLLISVRVLSMWFFQERFSSIKIPIIINCQVALMF